MTLLSAWALAGLLLSVPLVLVHLRRRRPPVREVSSLFAWRELSPQSASSSRRIGWPALPLLLALQLLALALLLFGLARPASALHRPASNRVYVVDASIWMGAQQRMARARRRVDAQLRSLPAGSSVSIVAAGATPSLVFSGPARRAEMAVGRLHVSDGQADFGAALQLAAGLRRRADAPIVLLRAPEDVLPAVRGDVSGLRSQVIGSVLDDQGLTDVQARCGLPGPTPCEVFARVFNTGKTARRDRVLVLEAGRPRSEATVAVAAEASTPVAFHVAAGLNLELSLPAVDSLAVDNHAFVAVPGTKPVKVTLIGEPSKAFALARALESTPDVEIRAESPADYHATDAGTSDLLVLDGWLPPGGLPPAPALLLIDPPRLPGGDVDGALIDSRLSGSDSTDGLLSDVDLASLTIAAHRAGRLTLPPWMTAVAWSPEGPLLAAGASAGQRVAALAFDPSDSDLPQLSSFPVLISNLIVWSQEWAPAQASAGEALLLQEPPGTTSATVSADGGQPRRLTVAVNEARALRLPQPGLYTITQRGSWGIRRETVAVNAGTARASSPSAPVQLSATPAAGGATRSRWWPWALAAALAALVAEWIYAARREPRLAVS